MNVHLPHTPCSTAVILAAGSGRRLGRRCKPLAVVAGRTLLERTVLTLRAAGVERIVVVTGHEKDTVRAFVEERGLDVELVENDAFLAGNGSSALVGGRAAAGRFLLTMVDHVFEPESIARMLESDAPFVAAVDTRARFCDVAEATKVRLAGSKILAVGRDLDPFDAVDGGLFVCDADVLRVAERAVASGEGTWNAIKRRALAEGHEIEAVDLAGAFWLDVDTPAEARRAERFLVRRAARKAHDGPVARAVNRRLSWPMSLLLLRAGVSPNGATLIAFGLAIAAAGVLALGAISAVALVIGGVFVQLASIVDGADGEIARASVRSSPAGGFLDSVLDRIGEAAVLTGLAVAAGLDGWLWLPYAGALVGALLVPYVKASYEASFGKPFPAPAYRVGLGHDVRMLLVAVAAVVLQPAAGLVALAVLANAEALRRFVAGWRSRD